MEPPTKGRIKSQLFSRFDPAEEKNKQFERDLRQALVLTDEQRSACLNALAEIRLARTKGERDPMVDRLSSETNLPRVTLNSAIDIMTFFLRELLSRECKGDTPQQWADDLWELKLVDSSEKARFEEMGRRIRDDVLPLVQGEVRRRASAAGVLPVLESCGVTVELRAVQDERYSWGSPINEYDPKILDLVGVVSVSIGVDFGTPDRFFFQMSEADLDYLVNEFVAAKRDVEALRQFVRSGQQGE